MHLQRQSEPSEVIRTWSTSPRACRTCDEPAVPPRCPTGPRQPQQTITANSLTAACPEIPHCPWGWWLCLKECVRHCLVQSTLSHHSAPEGTVTKPRELLTPAATSVVWPRYFSLVFMAVSQPPARPQRAGMVARRPSSASVPCSRPTQGSLLAVTCGHLGVSSAPQSAPMARGTTLKDSLVSTHGPDSRHRAQAGLAHFSRCAQEQGS